VDKGNGITVVTVAAPATAKLTPCVKLDPDDSK
jgi:hypothetical protein